MNKEYLRKKCYKMGNSQLPIDVFYNDIRDNPNPNFNKDEAYVDLKKIIDYIENLQKKNQELKNIIKIIINKGVNELLLKNTKIFAEYNTVIKHLEYFDELTQKEYKLLKEIFENE